MLLTLSTITMPAALPEFHLDARSNLSVGAGNTYSTLPQEAVHFENWSGIGQPHMWKRDAMVRHRIPGRIEAKGATQWLTGSSIGSSGSGSFKANVRFDDTANPSSSDSISVRLNVRVNGSISFGCLGKNRPEWTWVILKLAVKLNGVQQLGEYKLDSPDHLVTQSGLLAGLTGTDIFDTAEPPNPRGKAFGEIVTTAPFTVPLNQDVVLEVSFEAVSSAEGTSVCAISIGNFLSGIGFPFGQDAFTGVPAGVSVNSPDLFLQNNRWGPRIEITPDGVDVKVTWPSLLSTNMALQKAATVESGVQWESVTNEPSINGAGFEVVLPVPEPSEFFRLAEE
jgi:hypothetical protein